MPLTRARLKPEMADTRTGEKRPMDYALRVLSRRRISSGGLKHRLTRKGFSETDAESCTEKLREWGYLDDLGYARDVLTGLESECPVGRRRAKSELLRRSIDPVLAQEVVDEAYDGVSEEALALTAARKYLNGKDGRLLKEKERERLARWLQRRGFGYDGIRTALSALGQEDPE